LNYFFKNLELYIVAPKLKETKVVTCVGWIILLWFSINYFCYWHKKKSCPFPPPHIATTIQFDHVSTTFGPFKFANGLLH
jgi:hypothetical protein